MVRKRDHTAYTSWANMKQRCLNKNKPEYPHYGGRGISVCQEWLEFDQFARDMGDRPYGMTLERLDTDGDYCPDNCAWVTRERQAFNRRGYGACPFKWVRQIHNGRYEARYTHPASKKMVYCGYYGTAFEAHISACAHRLENYWSI